MSLVDDPIFEWPLRADNRRPPRGRRPIAWRAIGYLLPATVLGAGLLALPLVRTVWASFQAPGGGFTTANYDVLADPDVRHAMTNNAKWLLFSFVVLLLGVVLALLFRRIGQSRTFFVGVIAGPVAVSATVAGVAFRLVFDPLPERGMVAAVLAHLAGWLNGDRPRPQSIGALGPAGIAWVLASAFAWSWIGLTVLLLHAGLAGTRPDLSRMARSFGAGPVRAWWTALVPALVPLVPVVLLTVSVAAVRVFDVVLLAAPGSVQRNASVVGLLWWRAGGTLGPGRSAALAVLLTVAVAAVALAALWLLSRTWPQNAPSPPSAESPASPASTARAARVEPPPPAAGSGHGGRRRRRGLWWLLGVLVAGVWLVPLLVLLLTSLRRPEDAAVVGWWRGSGFSLDSYVRAYQAGVAGAAWSTLGRAVLATLLTLMCALPAAHALAHGGLSARARRWLLRAAVILAVLPVQAVAVPLGRELEVLGLSNTQLGLVLAHAALGLPFALLLLRAAFAGRPPSVPQAFAPRGTRWLSVLGSEAKASWMAVLAVAVLQFVQVWDDLVVGLLLSGSETGVLSLAVLGQGRQFAASSGPVAATAVISVLVPLTLVLATGRWLVRGLSAGVAR
jgi:alpha-glucoside transport system permease protein